MNDFKYTTTFNNIVRGSCLNCCDDFEVSQASLEKLQPLIPDSVDLEKNIDLVGVAFNAAVVNRFNRNGDGIDTTLAKDIKDYFINKPTNIEHNRKKVVGHIISSAFSSFESGELIHEDEASNGPFNIALGALVYRVVNPSFAKMLEHTKEGETFHNLISASWELGFNEYNIALGSTDLSSAEIITDAAQKEEFKQYLRAYDGEGKTDDGVEVYRIITGEVYPLGIGFTSNPAADVEGVYVAKPQSLEEMMNDAPAYIETRKKISKNEKKCSLSDDLHVKQSNDTIMDTHNLIQEFEKVLTEKLGEKQSEEAVANMTSVINESIKQKDEEYRAEKEAKEKLAETVEAQKVEFENSVTEMKEKLATTEAQLSELQEQNKQREAKELFNARMSSLEESFELGEADWKIVASELADLDSEEESFSSYVEKLNVVWEHKTKAFIEEQDQNFKVKLEEELEKRLASLQDTKASTQEEEEEEEEDVEEILEEASAETFEAPNNSAEASEEEPSLRDKFAAAFSTENITIKY